MDCHDFRLLIDERVHGSLSGDLLARLEEHLRECSDCREDLRQLEKTRALLGAARTDSAKEAELRTVWNAVQRAMAPQAATLPATPIPARALPARIGLTRWKKVAIASLMTAAVFMMALLIGKPKRSHSGRKEVAIASKDDTIRRQETLIAQEKSEKDALADQNRQIAEQNNSLADKYAKIADAANAQHREREVSNESLTVKSVKESQLENELKITQQTLAAVTKDKRSIDEDLALQTKRLERVLKSGVPVASVLSEDSPSPPPPPPSDADKSKTPLFPLGGGAGEEGLLRDKNGSIEGRSATGEEQPPAAHAEATQPKIIKTGELTIEIKNFVDSSRAVEVLAAKFQGVVADSRTTELPGAAKRGDIVIRVAPERFEELFGELKKLGVVLQDRAGAADITAQYVDTEARIKNMQVAEERLQELIKSKTFMDKIQSLLEVERELARVRGEIESMQGQMRVWQNQIGLSTIRLTLQEAARAVPSGSLSVEVQNLSDAKKALDAALTNAGAQLLNGQSSKRSDGTLMGNYALRVKFGRFAELTGAIKGLGRVQDEKIQNQPFAAGVPDGAQEVPCELALVLFERSIQLPTGSVQIEVGALPDALQKLDLALTAAQATIVSNQSQRQSNGAASAQISIRVRAGNFAALAEALPALGRVSNRTIGGESGKIQGGAAEVPCTLELQLSEQQKEVPGGTIAVEVGAFTAARDGLSALIKDESLQVRASDSQQRADGTWVGSFTIGVKAEKMDGVIGKVEKLGRVKSREVRGLGLGDLSRTDPNVLGEITVTLQEAPAIAPQEEGSFRLMMRDTFGGFLTSMGYVIRGLGMMLPWLLLVALLGALIWRVTRTKHGGNTTKNTPS